MFQLKPLALTVTLCLVDTCITDTISLESNPHKCKNVRRHQLHIHFIWDDGDSRNHLGLSDIQLSIVY